MAFWHKINCYEITAWEIKLRSFKKKKVGLHGADCSILPAPDLRLVIMVASKLASSCHVFEGSLPLIPVILCKSDLK